jgi:hypothetical protein
MKAAGSGEYNRYLVEGLRKKSMCSSRSGARFEVLTALLLKVQILWDVTLYLWMCSFP